MRARRSLQCQVRRRIDYHNHTPLLAGTPRRHPSAECLIFAATERRGKRRPAGWPFAQRLHFGYFNNVKLISPETVFPRLSLPVYSHTIFAPQNVHVAAVSFTQDVYEPLPFGRSFIGDFFERSYMSLKKESPQTFPSVA